MPDRSPFAAVLVLALLPGWSVAQQWGGSSVGPQDAPAGTLVGATPAPGAVSPLPGRYSPGLVQPAILETPDRYVPSVRPASHTAGPEPLVPGQAGTQTLLSAAGPAETPATPAGPPIDPASPDETPAAPAGSAADSAPLTTLAAPDAGFPVLAPPETARSGAGSQPPRDEAFGATVTVISSLATVLGLFFLTAWILRRTGTGALATLPGEVFESLGRAHHAGRQQVQLLRCGNRLLLVSLTPDSAETLTEIDDPDEVTRLAGLCRANQSGSATAAFRQVLNQFARQPAEPGFVGRGDPSATRTRLPAREEFHA
ncbi:MAG: FliO/MopB family protein [Thermoguttaceae bacterium]